MDKKPFPIPKFENFYEQLPTLEEFGRVVEFEQYRPVPSDWLVVVADIVESTKAIEEGKYKQVNVVGAAIITAISKLFHPREIPYIFAGDGVFLCVPPRKMTEIRKILSHLKLLAKRQFGLRQVSGMVPVGDIRSSDRDIRVAKFRISEQYSQAAFEGGGLEQAERMVRDPGMAEKYQVDPALHPEIDLSNLECRWNHLESIYDEIICVLVKVVADERQDEVYKRVVHAINRIYCKDFVCTPVQEERVSLTFDWDKLSVEYKIRTFGKNWWEKLAYLAELAYKQLAGKVVMYFGLHAGGADWGRYKKDLEQNTDYRKFDDMVREVLSGTEAQRKKLLEFLEPLYNEGKIVYGLHVTPTVMLTCMVMNYSREHFHFVDGSAGGYAAAAAEMKEKINKLSAPGT